MVALESKGPTVCTRIECEAASWLSGSETVKISGSTAPLPCLSVRLGVCIWTRQVTFRGIIFQQAITFDGKWQKLVPTLSNYRRISNLNVL